ncbi:hypothetical protein Syncc8109_0749 [Synechococcus sp. WH 8109]|nr:hypothetical protein Syncc8109_0749 [Synechococcus sp. WH 8109]
MAETKNFRSNEENDAAFAETEYMG